MNMKHLYTSLDSGVTSGSVTDNSITDDSVIEIYFDNTDCYIDTTSQSGHTVYFTVGGNATGTNVCVVVNNLTNFTPYNDADIRERVAQTEQDIINLETTVDGLNASNINYDEHSTLYSAMGDIDSLETTSKNLVGAINEVKESGGGGGTSVDFIPFEDFITMNTGYVLQNGSIICKIGNAILVYINVTKTNGNFTTGQNVIGNIKEKYRNTNEMRTYGMMASESYNTSSTTAYITVPTSGNVEVWGNATNYKNVKFFCMLKVGD